MPLKKIFQKSEKKDAHNNVPLATAKKKSGPTTYLKVHYNAGYPNNLYIRGQGAGLSWDLGTPLKNISPDEWVWETNEIFPSCAYKLLINDTLYETGDNHEIRCGATMECYPNFP